MVPINAYHQGRFSRLLSLMGRFAEEVGGFQEGAHGGRELRGSGQDDAEEVFRCTAIGGLAFASTIKGLCPAEDILFREIAGS